VRPGQVWALVLAVLAVPMPGGWHAVAALLAVLLLLADDRERRQHNEGVR